MLCKNCGDSIDSRYLTCPSCSQPTGFLVGLDGNKDIDHLKAVRTLTDKNTKPIFITNDSSIICNSCGKNNESNAAYCVACGNGLKIPQIVAKPRPVQTHKAKSRMKKLSIAVIAEGAIIFILSVLLLIQLIAYKNLENKNYEETTKLPVTTTSVTTTSVTTTSETTTSETTTSETTTSETTTSETTTSETTTSKTTTSKTTTSEKTTSETTMR